MTDVFTEQEAIARRRKLMDAMTTQNMQTPIVGHTGVGQMLAKLATAWVLKNKGKGLAQEDSDNRSRYQTELGGALGDFMDKRMGKPGETMTDSQAAALMHNGQAPELADPVQANPRQAIIEAMASKFPELQAIGKAELAGLGKGQLTQKDILGLSGFDPKSRLTAALGGDISALQPERKEHVVNGQVVTGLPGQGYSAEADFRDQFAPKPETIGGDLYQRNTGTQQLKKLDNAPKTTVSVSPTINVTNKGEEAFTKALGGDVAAAFKTARDEAAQGYKTLGVLNQMKELESQGVFSGPTANIATGLSGLGKVLGIPVDEAKLANSEAFRQQFSQQVAAVIAGAAGRSMTDADRKVLEDSLPTLLQSPEGRQRVYAMMEQSARTAVVRHKSFQEQLEKQYPEYAGMLTLNPLDLGPSQGVQSPQAPTAPAHPQQRKPSVSNWN